MQQSGLSGDKWFYWFRLFSESDILLLYFLLYGLIMGAVSVVLGWKAFAFIKVLKNVANKE